MDWKAHPQVKPALSILLKFSRDSNETVTPYIVTSDDTECFGQVPSEEGTRCWKLSWRSKNREQACHKG